MEQVDSILSEILSRPVTAPTHEFSENFYRSVNKPTDGYFQVSMPFTGTVNGQETNRFNIAYTAWGKSGPLVLALHGVPTNRKQYRTLQSRMKSHCRFLAIDMLGMGQSDHPLNYGQRYREMEGYEWATAEIENGAPAWSWIFDAIYLRQIHLNYLNGEKLYFIADDWGGGILSHYAALFGDDLKGAIWIDPIAFDGYPVSEIQAIGRASQLDDEAFRSWGMGAVDQTMVQIFKTMVYDPNVWDQYTLRDIKQTYIDVDYQRPGASSLTLGLKFNALRVLADRAAVLSPDQLLPRGPKYPLGVQYSQIRCPCHIIWGLQDNMMPERQIWRFYYVLSNAESVSHTSVDQAGHFAAVDQPDAVAESIMGFIMRTPEGRASLGDAFLGLGGKHRHYKGDEREVIADLRALYGMEGDATPTVDSTASPLQVSSMMPSASPSSISSRRTLPLPVSSGNTPMSVELRPSSVIIPPL